MKIRTKMAAGFVSMAFLVLFVGVVSTEELRGIAKPLGVDVQEKIKESFDNIVYASKMEEFADKIRFYDEVLTQSARNYAFTGDMKWETRYREAGRKLDGAIKEALSVGDYEDRKFFADVDQSNKELAEFEYKSIALVNENKTSEALAILDGANYSKNKAIYSTGLQNFFTKRSAQKSGALSGTKKTLDFVSVERDMILVKATTTVTGVVVAVIALSLALSLALSFVISKPIVRLTKVIDDISKGRFESEIDDDLKNDNSEISELARSFNRMIVSLKLAMRETSPQLREELNNLRAGMNDVGQVVEMLDRCYIVSKTDKNGKIDYVNDVFCELSKYAKAELIGSRHNIVNSGFHSKAFWEKFWGILNGGKVWRGDVRNKAKDGTIYWVRSVVSPSFDKDGKITGFVSVRYLINDLMEDVERDIANRKETETIRRLRDGE